MVPQPLNTALWENYAAQVKLSDKKLMSSRNVGPRTLSSVDTQHLQLASRGLNLSLRQFAVLLKISPFKKKCSMIFYYKITEDC